MLTSAKVFRAVLFTAMMLGGVSACEDSGPIEQLGEDMDEAVDDAGDAIDDTADDIDDGISR